VFDEELRRLLKRPCFVEQPTSETAPPDFVATPEILPECAPAATATFVADDRPCASWVVFSSAAPFITRSALSLFSVTMKRLLARMASTIIACKVRLILSSPKLSIKIRLAFNSFCVVSKSADSTLRVGEVAEFWPFTSGDNAQASAQRVRQFMTPLVAFTA